MTLLTPSIGIGVVMQEDEAPYQNSFRKLLLFLFLLGS